MSICTTCRMSKARKNKGQSTTRMKRGLCQILNRVATGGHEVKEEMPWQYLGQMSDEELKAVWLYLQSVPAREQGRLEH